MSSRYNSASDVVLVGLRLLEEHETKIEARRRRLISMRTSPERNLL